MRCAFLAYRMDMGIAGWKRKPAACKFNLIFVHHLFGKCYYGFIHNNFSEGWSFIRYFYAYVCVGKWVGSR